MGLTPRLFRPEDDHLLNGLGIGLTDLVKTKSGIDSDTAKKIQTAVKQSKLKVQAAIQGESVRVTGAKRDDLQTAMALIRKDIPELPLSFNNFRD